MSDVVEVATTTVTVTVASPSAATVSQTVTQTTVDAGIRGPQGPMGPAGADSTVPGPLRQVECRADWVSPYSYTGVAPIDSADLAAVWTIMRMQVLGNGSVSVGIATGVTWDDRLTCAYS